MGHEFEPLSGRILEAAVAEHRALGPGLLESVYQKAMKVALRHRNRHGSTPGYTPGARVLMLCYLTILRCKSLLRWLLANA